MIFPMSTRFLLRSCTSRTSNVRSFSSTISKASQYPPTYFTNPSVPPQSNTQLSGQGTPEYIGHNGIPTSQNQGSGSPLHSNNMLYSQAISADQAVAESQKKYSRSEPLKDLALCIAILGLTYFAVDNYHTRVTLQQEFFKASMEQQKAVALAQMTFNNARKKREIQVLNERKNFQKREMKMALHVALLRKQLENAGVKPVDINDAVEEFEKSVKMENSLANISGTNLWVIDESKIKPYVPSMHEYDKK